MTNKEIVINEAVIKQIFTKEQACSYMKGGDIPLKTDSEWKKAGFRIRQGQTPVLETKLWKYIPQKKAGNFQDKFIFILSALFSADQVEPINMS